MILEKVRELLKNRQFISIATADKSGEPHAAPKFLYKIEGADVYLIDYAIAKTVHNLRANPRASISFMDLENLEGYRMTGSVVLIEKGAAFEKILEDFNKKLVKLSADRLLESVRTGKKHEHYELEIPDKVIVIKVHVEEAVRIGRQGDLFREKTSD